MKYKKFLRVLLCLLLTCGTVLSLCACPGNVPDGPGTPDDPNTPDGPNTPDDPNTPDGPDTPEKPVPSVYPNGAAVDGAGATIPAGSPALTPTVYDPAGATEIKANLFFRSSAREEGKVFSVSDGKPVTVSNAADQTYDGKGAILIAPHGLIIENCQDIRLINLTVVGSVFVRDVQGILLENVQILSAEEGIALDETSEGLLLQHCRVAGRTALSFFADDSTVLYSHFTFTEAGITDRAARGTVIRHCVLEGSGVGLSSSAKESDFRNLTLSLDAGGTGISIGEGAENTLAALNVVQGAQKSLSVRGAHNAVVILSSLVSVEAEGNRDLFICDNALGGRLTVKNNNYLICDNNETPADGYDHTPISEGNRNRNGNDVTDVNFRPEAGADEALLPHIDKELFIGMERKKTVRDTLYDKAPTDAMRYIIDLAATQDVVILPPGAYTTNYGPTFGAAHKNTKIYAYGAYVERQGSDSVMGFNGAENVTVKGMTIGYEQQSCGQLYVLEKLGNQRIRVVPGAGMAYDMFTGGGMGAQRMGTFYAYCDTGMISLTDKDTVCGVLTQEMYLSAAEYEMYAAGDILTARLGGGTTVVLRDSADVTFYDFNIYGFAGGFAYVENNMRTATNYYRVCNTTKSGPLIGEELYENYRALEEKYGVVLEVSRDEQGRARGSLPHIGSIDATHTTNCAQGSQATFCLFENMCDDATNQNHTAARLHEVKDNGDGTTTVIYKGVHSEWEYDNKRYVPNILCDEFKVGDRVYIYTAAGQLLCDTVALTATEKLADLRVENYGHNVKVPVRAVTIRTDTLNTAPLADYDLTRFDKDPSQKVLIDNMSMASNGFKFDNCKFQNIRSRGLLIKSSEGVIRNCTFRNIGMACAAILYEIYWGESGVTENMKVERNLIDHTGYFRNQPRYAGIAIEGLGGKSVEEDFLCYRNIEICYNRIVNRTTDYAVFINSAKDVKIIGNYFGEFVGNDFTGHKEAPESEANPKPVIFLQGALNIEISDNRFPETGFIQDQVVVEKNKNVFGNNVETEDGTTLIPDNV